MKKKVICCRNCKKSRRLQEKRILSLLRHFHAAVQNLSAAWAPPQSCWKHLASCLNHSLLAHDFPGNLSGELQAQVSRAAVLELRLYLNTAECSCCHSRQQFCCEHTLRCSEITHQTPGLSPGINIAEDPSLCWTFSLCQENALLFLSWKCCKDFLNFFCYCWSTYYS